MGNVSFYPVTSFFSPNILSVNANFIGSKIFFIVTSGSKMWHPSLNGRALEVVARPESNRKVYWQCDCLCPVSKQPHVWRASRRVKDKLGCPVCALTTICTSCSSGCNSIQALCPKIAIFSGKDPKLIAPNSSRRFHWCGFVRQQQVSIWATVRMVREHSGKGSSRSLRHTFRLARYKAVCQGAWPSDSD